MHFQSESAGLQARSEAWRVCPSCPDGQMCVFSEREGIFAGRLGGLCVEKCVFLEFEGPPEAFCLVLSRKSCLRTPPLESGPAEF